MGTPKSSFENDKPESDEWFVEIKGQKNPFGEQELIPPLSFEDLIEKARKRQELEEQDQHLLIKDRFKKKLGERVKSPISKALTGKWSATPEVVDYRSFVQERFKKNNSDEILREIEQLSEVCRRTKVSTKQPCETFFPQMTLLFFSYWICQLNISKEIWEKFCVREVVNESYTFLMDNVDKKWLTFMDDRKSFDELLVLTRLMVRGFKCVIEGLNPKFIVYLPLQHYSEVEKYIMGVKKERSFKKNETKRFRKLLSEQRGGLATFSLFTVLESAKTSWEEKNTIAAYFLHFENQGVIEALLTTEYIRYIRNEAIKKVYQDIAEELERKIPGYKEYKKKNWGDNIFEAVRFESELGQETTEVAPSTGMEDFTKVFRPIESGEMSAKGENFSMSSDIEFDNDIGKEASGLRCLIYGTFKDTNIVQAVKDELYRLIGNFPFNEWYRSGQDIGFFMMNKIKNRLRPIYRSNKWLKEWRKENRSKETLKITERKREHFARVENVPKLSWKDFLACIGSSEEGSNEKLPKLFQRLLRTESYRIDALTNIAESVCSKMEKTVVIPWLEEVANSRGDINDKQFHNRIAKELRISPSNVRTTKCRGLKRLVPELKKL